MTTETTPEATGTAAPDAALLAIRDLHVTYATGEGGLPAVRGVDLTVARGQIVGVAGESGCGKSTLASTVLRLQPPSATVSGQVLFDGRDVLAMRWGELRAVRWAGASIVFQGALHSLNPVHRIGAQLAEPMHIHQPGLDEARVTERVAELLDQVGMAPERAKSYPHQLSGGQKQRVMIAMALACDPELVVADEPTTALDVMVQAQVLNVLSELVRGRGVGMMMISHDLSVLADLCDRITVMYAGRVIEEGPADQVFAAPLHPYSGALSAAFPRVGDPAARFAPAGLPGDPPDPRNLTEGCSFAPRCPRAAPVCLHDEPGLVAYDDRAAACVRIGEPDLEAR
ncbi:MAG TPA: ABC transporter ATP-binding protein [Nocardioides sp.]|jgi:peptide/nickel transport system ATP-binding protein|uniref:ABC transporter ATP-binding protein n=1 Tax=Nocardioides sp. TaxID=35761 RepID=UPI002E35D7BB|nr:ABC transporter ATP-binding protein [Nocardioides sp.]HEX3931559.1 ABC transporter ATP-binding protein [Nocardioides sp.]